MGYIWSLRDISVFALKLRSGIRQFSPQPITRLSQFRFSQQCDLITLSQHFCPST